MGVIQAGKSLLRDSARELLYHFLLKPLPGPFRHVRGHVWKAELPKGAHRAENTVVPSLLLFENRRYLGPEEYQTNQVEIVGRGWFRQTTGSIEFSTSDNSDPNTNGRNYSFANSKWLHARQSGTPVNLQSLSNDPAKIESDVEYALAGRRYLASAKSVGIQSLRGKHVLELGPGINLGHAALLACSGANVTTVDPFPAQWQSDYHQKFYGRLKDRLADDPEFDVRPLEELLAADQFLDEVIRQTCTPVEALELEDETFDAVFSTAVGEHFYDPALAFEQLHRVTKPGGCGFHSIDFRDHRDFDRPLEYLLMPRDEFEIEFGLHRGEIGTQIRLKEYLELIQDAGFEIVSMKPATIPSEGYLREFLPRLRGCSKSAFRDYPAEELKNISAHVCVRRHA